MKIKVGILFLAVLLALCSCTGGADDYASTETSVEISTEEKVEAFGGDNSFDYHYAMAADSLFYIKSSPVGDKNDGIVRFSKTNFKDKTLIAKKSAFGVKAEEKFSATVVGVSSLRLFVAVSDKVYSLTHDGNDVKLLAEGAVSVYSNGGRIYFTRKDESGGLKLNCFDTATEETTVVDTGDYVPEGYYWCRLKGGKIGLLNYPNGVVVDAKGEVQVREISEEEKQTDDLGRDETILEKVKGFVTEGCELESYALCSGYVYYIERGSEGNTLYRIDENGEGKTTLKENTLLYKLFSYNGVLYGDVNIADADHLMKVDEKGDTTETGAVTEGAGQTGYVKIEGGLFIRTYKYINPPRLVYVYNPETGEVINR